MIGWLLWIRRDALRGWPFVVPAVFVGALPWLLGNLRHDWYSLHPGPNEGSWTNHVHNLVSSTLPEALGLRLAWSYEWVGGVFVGLVIYAAVLGWFVWLLKRRPSKLVPLLLILVVFPIFYFVSPYTWLESEPRYLTLVMPVFAILIAAAMTNTWRTIAILAVALALSVGGMVELERHDVAPFRTEGTAVPGEPRTRAGRAPRGAPALCVRELLDRVAHHSRVGYEDRRREGELCPPDAPSEGASIPATRRTTVASIRRTTPSPSGSAMSHTSSCGAVMSSHAFARSCAPRRTGVSSEAAS